MNIVTPSAHPRKSGGWEAVYYYHKDPISGARKKISAYGKTKEETESKLNSKLKQLESGCYIEPHHTTIAQWFLHWLELYERPKLKQSTYVSYRSTTQTRIIPALGDIPLSKVKIDVLQQFLNDTYAHGNKRYEGQPLSPKTIKNLYRIMHTAFSQAVQNGLIPYNYATALTIPKPQHIEMRVLTTDEHKRLFRAIQESQERHRIGILVCLATGIRVGELAGLKWSDIDLISKQLKIRRTLGRYATTTPGSQKTEIVISAPKSRKSLRDIPISAFLAPYLLLQKEMQQQEGSYSPDGFFVCSDTGTCAEPRWLQDTFHRLTKVAGIANASCHCMRHTFATRAVEAGMDPKTLSVLLGHADVSTTLNYYTHSLEEQKRKAMNLMDLYYPTNYDSANDEI